MSAVQEIVTEAPTVEAVPKRAMTLGYGASLAILAVLIVVPLFVKNFIIFQLTMLLIYALAVLALNILTGGSGQFSLGQSAFYAVGAYTSAILMEHAGINYALTLPIAGIVCFAFGYLFGQPALRLCGVYLALATFALATAMPQLLKLGGVRALDRRRAGPGGDQAARCLAVRPQDVAGHVAVLFHARGLDRDLYFLGQSAEIALRPRLHGDPRQRDRGLRDGHRRRAVQDAGVRRLRRHHRRRRRPRRHRRAVRGARQLHHHVCDLAVSRHGGRRRRLAARIDRGFGLHHLRAEHRGGNFKGSVRRRVRRAAVPRHLPCAARRTASGHGRRRT